MAHQIAGRPDGHIGSEFPRALDQGQGQQVGGHDHGNAFGSGPFDEGFRIAQLAVRGRVLDQDAEEILRERRHLFKSPHHEFESERLDTGAKNPQGLGVTVF